MPSKPKYSEYVVRKEKKQHNEAESERNLKGMFVLIDNLMILLDYVFFDQNLAYEYVDAKVIIFNEIF